MTKTDTDVLAKIKQDMQDRMDKLKPAVDEYNSLAEALKRLDHKRPGRPRKNAA